MQLPGTVKLYMTRKQKALITATMTEYINTVNKIKNSFYKYQGRKLTTFEGWSQLPITIIFKEEEIVL